MPASGPAVIAANHPSYLDPLLLSLRVRRPIHFMAWDALFRVPLARRPDARLRRVPGGRAARARAARPTRRPRRSCEPGEVVGIFPEGKRSRTGWLEPALREGAARLAWETGAPLVPATIAGAYRAWPHFQSLPRPARIRVRFHDADRPARPGARLAEDEALPALLAELRRRVERSLLPGVKADLRMNAALPPARARGRARYESAPALALAAARLLEDAVAGGGGAGLGLRRLPAAGPLRDPAVAAREVDPQRLARPLPARLRALRPARTWACPRCPRARPWPRSCRARSSPTSTSAAAPPWASCAGFVAAACLELARAVPRAHGRGTARRPARSSPPPSPGSAKTVFWRYAAPVLAARTRWGARCSSGPDALALLPRMPWRGSWAGWSCGCWPYGLLRARAGASRRRSAWACASGRSSERTSTARRAGDAPRRAPARRRTRPAPPLGDAARRPSALAPARRPPPRPPSHGTRPTPGGR